VAWRYESTSAAHTPCNLGGIHS